MIKADSIPPREYSFQRRVEFVTLRVPTWTPEGEQSFEEHGLSQSTCLRLATELDACIGAHPHDWCRRERESLWDALKAAEGALEDIYHGASDHHTASKALGTLNAIRATLSQIRFGETRPGHPSHTP